MTDAISTETLCFGPYSSQNIHLFCLTSCRAPVKKLENVAVQ